MMLAGPNPSRMGKGSARILLVEDSNTVRLLTAEYLRSRGHDVVDVESAEQALALLKHDQFDLLFTDLSLPGMSGADLVGVVRHADPSMAMIVSSGFDVMPDIDLSTPGVRFLAKPYDLDALNRALDGIVPAQR